MFIIYIFNNNFCCVTFDSKTWEEITFTINSVLGIYTSRCIISFFKIIINNNLFIDYVYATII